MDNETIEDIKSEIAFYITIDDQIQKLTERKSKVSPNFYAMTSLTGGMPINDDVEQLYHRADTTEHIALMLWAKDITLQRRIDRLKQKQRLFQQCMGGEVLARLEHDLRLFYVTELEWQAYEAIGEVEYYLEEYRKTKDKQRFNKMASKDKEFVECEQNILSRMEGLLNA